MRAGAPAVRPRRLAALDFGLSNLDGVVLEDGRLQHAWSAPTSAPASQASLLEALENGGLDPATLDLIATTGGRHRELPTTIAGVGLARIGEAAAVARGGLALSGVERALVVSAGSGTAMIAGGPGEARHVTGSAVGGGTLLGLARLLLGTTDPAEVARLASAGDPAGVDSTLADALGGGIGHLPPTATAVNLGRLALDPRPPSREDLAAGLVTLIAQVIGVIAVNAARAEGLRQIVVIGRLPELAPVRAALERVWAMYAVDPRPLVPRLAGSATALGAALEAAGLERLAD